MERIIGAIFLAAVLLMLLILSVRTYNGLVVLRSFCAEGWSGVLAAVRRRRAAVSRTLRTMALGSPEERALLEMLEMRSACARDASEWDVGDLLRAETELAENLPFFLPLCERCEREEGSEKRDGRRCVQPRFPELSAEEVEMAMNYYNATARDYNTCLRQFPANLIGWAFRFREVEYFESDPLGSAD